MKRSHAGRWRAYSLAGVHVLMLAHVLHWLWAGNTLTPIEPSESMETIRSGQINMGFLFFAVALIATLILGRWVCGWGCHLIAYQDLTLWLLKKLRMRPKAFRSRFLVFIPLLAAAYMFLYPLALHLWHAYQGGRAPPLGWHLSRTGFWDTFPGPLFAILTVLICGVAIIYFLGPKGFCTYACPYGAFFGFTDKFAPGRIRVTDACRQCGHCSAVCTSNVNVAEEVRLYKMVVDPGCMKCLDCVQVCPNDALYYGFGRPSVAAGSVAPRKPRRYDMSLAEEFLAVAVFGGSFFAVRGLYGLFPFLFSLGLAGVMTYLVIKGLRLLYARDVLVQRVRLKVAGNIKPLGVTYFAGLAVLIALTIHSGIWQYHKYLADRAFAQSPPKPMNWQYDPHFADRTTDAQQAAIADGIYHYEACDRWGLADDAENEMRLAWLYLFTAERRKAAELIHKVADDDPRQGDKWFHLAKIETFLGHPKEARTAYQRAIEDYLVSLDAYGDRVPILYNLANALTTLRRYDQAVSYYRRALALSPGEMAIRDKLAAVLFIQRDFSGAITEFEYILEKMPTNAEAALRLGTVYQQVGRTKDAAKMFKLAARHGDPTQRQNAEMLLRQIAGSGSSMP